MKRIKKLFTNIWFYFGLFIVSLIVPFIINELYKIGVGYQTIWDAPDVLAFYGSYLSFFGTVILGAVAVFQTERANEQAEKANELAIEMQKSESAKFVSMVSIKDVCIARHPSDKTKFRNPVYSNFEIINMCDDGFESNQSFFVDALFENNSDYPIVQISIHAGDYGNAAHLLYGIKTVSPAIYIPPNGSQAIRLLIPCEVFDCVSKYNLTIKIGLVNIFNYVTWASLFLIDMDNKEKKGEWFYRLAKISDVNPNGGNQQ